MNVVYILNNLFSFLIWFLHFCMDVCYISQAIGPELTFYNSSRDAGDSMVLSTKLLHAQLDVFCR